MTYATEKEERGSWWPEIRLVLGRSKGKNHVSSNQSSAVMSCWDGYLLFLLEVCGLQSPLSSGCELKLES